MECEKQDACSIKAEHIDNEISNSLEHVHSQKELALSVVKIYLSIVFGFFVYAAFIQTKVIAKTVPIPSVTYTFYATFGVAITFFVFFLGWVLLDFITNAIFAAVIHYKHVSYMRKLKAEIVGGSFQANCILPMATKEIHLKRARHLPIAFSVINLMLLCANYYFLSLVIPTSLAVSYTMLCIGFFAIWYPNVCAKYYEEILIAQKMSPGRDEKRMRQIVHERIQANKAEMSHMALHWVVIVIFALFLFSLGWGFYLHYVSSIEISAHRNWSSFVLLILLFILRYAIAQYRVEKEIVVFKKVRFRMARIRSET